MQAKVHSYYRFQSIQINLPSATEKYCMLLIDVSENEPWLVFNQKCNDFGLHTRYREGTSECKYVKIVAADGQILSLRGFFLMNSWQETRASSRDSGNILGDWRKKTFVAQVSNH